MPDKDIKDDDLFDKDQNKDDKPIIDDKGDTSSKPSVDDKPATNPLLANIVNENGEQKYKTDDEALKALPHAQEHIVKIERELAELREKGNSSDKLDELLEAVRQSKESGDGGQSTPAMNPEDVLSIVKDYVSDNKAAENRQSNIDTVTKAFRDRFGKDASKELYGKADDLGFSRTEINRMVANNPNAALKVLGVEVKKQPKVDTMASHSQVDAGQFQGTPPSKPTSVMGATSAKVLNEAWAANKKRTLERLGLTED